MKEIQIECMCACVRACTIVADEPTYHPIHTRSCFDESEIVLNAMRHTARLELGQCVYCCYCILLKQCVLVRRIGQLRSSVSVPSQLTHHVMSCIHYRTRTRSHETLKSTSHTWEVLSATWQTKNTAATAAENQTQNPKKSHEMWV